jgi:hypothetical protein
VAAVGFSQDSWLFVFIKIAGGFAPPAMLKLSRQAFRLTLQS